MSEWSGAGWAIAVTDAGLVLVQGSDTNTVPRSDGALLKVRRRWLRWALYDATGMLVRLRGMSGAQASDLARAVRRLAAGPGVDAAVVWHAAAATVIDRAIAQQRWI